MAIAALPLATVTSVAFAAPLFVTTLSALVLGEPVDRRGWSAVVVGFVGVLDRAAPGGGGVRPAALLAVLSALCYAISQTITRYLGRRDSGATIVFSATLVSAWWRRRAGCCGRGRSRRRPPSERRLPGARLGLPPWGALGRMVLCGFISSVGIYCLTQAYRVAPASTVSPFEYAMIGWAVLWGYVFWGDVPGPATLFGVATTVAPASTCCTIKRALSGSDAARPARRRSSRPFWPARVAGGPATSGFGGC